MLREKGYTNMGTAVQAYLYRAEADTRHDPGQDNHSSGEGRE